jgi:hypothetical protein
MVEGHLRVVKHTHTPTGTDGDQRNGGLLSWPMLVANSSLQR